MVRTDDDDWGVTESVGATALGAAEVRAREADNECPLFTDPYAQMFLDAAAARGWSSQTPRMHETDPQMWRRVRAIWDYTASRTKWFDEFFIAAGAAGVGQMVMLAAGLDTRAWRLPWANRSVVYEIDQPRVLQFKANILESHGAEPSARYIAVAVDLRQDWPKALRGAGFDPAAPTAWSTEGLLPYLSGNAQDLLFERIDALSVAGSRIGVDALSAEFYSPANLARLKVQFDQFREAAAKAGSDQANTSDLWVGEQHTDVAEWLRSHGWEVESIEVHDLMARYHREAPADVADAIPQCRFINGQR
jgi:methyltransferase (TIGR00027 family)